MKVCFLGLGAMGERMAEKLAGAGHDLTVWNRTRTTAEEAAPDGATIADTPAEAARGAEVVFSMVRDDEASANVWETPEDGGFAGGEKGAIVVECSTLTPQYMEEWAAKATAAGLCPLGAPLSGSRPQAEAASLVFFAGGEARVREAVSPLLLAMGSAVCPLESPKAAALVKLAVNAYYGVQLAALGEVTALFEKAGIDRAAAAEAMKASPVASPVGKIALDAMAGRDHPPLFPIDLVAKDFGYAFMAARRVEAAVPVITAGGKAFAQAAAAGLGDLNITGIVERYREKPTS